MTQIFQEADNHLVESLDELSQAALATLAAFFSDLQTKFTYTISLKNSVVLADGTKLNGGFQKVQTGFDAKGNAKYKNANNKFLVMTIFLATDAGVPKKIQDVVIAPLNSIAFNPTTEQLRQFADALPLKLAGTLQDVISAENAAVSPVPDKQPQQPAGDATKPKTATNLVGLLRGSTGERKTTIKVPGTFYTNNFGDLYDPSGTLISAEDGLPISFARGTIKYNPLWGALGLDARNFYTWSPEMQKSWVAGHPTIPPLT